MDDKSKNDKPRNEVAIVRQQLSGMGAQFKAALPAHIPVERFERVVMTAIQNNPDLLTCSRKSLFNSAMKSAQDGLLPDGREGAIVPFGKEAQWMPMIGGLRKKVRNSGEIATWDVQAVYENDAFEFQLGDTPFIRHKPTLGEPGKLVAVYSIATLKSGEISRDVMSVGAVEKIRTKSRGKNTPWNDVIFYAEMAKKTVARRHSKVLPMSSDLDDLMRRDDDLYDLKNAGDEQNRDRPKTLESRLDAIADHRDEVVDGEVVDVVDDEQQDIDERDPTTVAADLGRENRGKGMSRKAIPAEYRKDEELTKAYLEGFDGGDE